jgi:hypothetical protein
VHEPDAYRCAGLLIKEHGEHALAQALLRRCELQAAADQKGVAAWEQIIAAVQVLRRTERMDGEARQ